MRGRLIDSRGGRRGGGINGAEGRRNRERAAMEPLEVRRLFTAVVVNTLLDGVFPPSTGLTSLRNAIQIANASATPTTITFAASVFTPGKTIVLNGSALQLQNSSQPITITGPSGG